MIGLLLLVLLVATPAWAIDAAVTRVALNTSTGTQNITFSDFSENCQAVPCAVFVIVSEGIADNTLADDAMLSVGFSDGTNESSVSIHDNDTGATSDTHRFARNDRLFTTQDAAGPDGIAVFNAWLTNGVQINITDAPPAAFLMTVGIIGGSGMQVKVGNFISSGTVDGAVDVTSVGFEADVVFLLSGRIGTASGSATEYLFTMGAAANGGNQASIGCNSRHGVSAVSNPHAMSSTLYASALTDFNGLDLSILVSGFDSQGFTGTTKIAATAAAQHYLAIAFGGPDSAVLDIDTPTSTGTASTTVGFKTLFGITLGTLATAYDDDMDDANASQCMISMYTANNAYTNAAIVEDATAAEMNTKSISAAKGVLMGNELGVCSAGSCFDGSYDLSGTDLVIDYDSVHTDAVRKWVGFVVEDETAAPGGARRRGVHVIQ